MLYVKQGNGRYRVANEMDVRDEHISYICESVRGAPMGCPDDSKRFLVDALASEPSELFACVFMDSRNRVLGMKVMFRGTIDGATVHPREVVRACITHNASGMIVAHNHPSGVAEPSRADRALTRRLREAVELVDVRLLDHFVIGDNEVVSFAERGWL